MTIHTPRDEQDAAAIIRDAAGKGTLLSVTGQGTKAPMGRPNQTDASISSAALTGVTIYEPAELVISVRSGTPVSEVVRTLAAKGQELPFEPMDYRPLLGTTGEPTMGAVAAMNISGPRRIMAGAARDSLLGVRFVNGRGEVVKSGGRVMKNVTGLDLVKLMAGSWGTLGFLTEVTFKVLPAPEETGTLLLFGLPDEIGVEVLCTAMSSPYEVSAAVHLQPPLAARLEHSGLRSQGKAVTALRIENFARSVAYRKGRLKDLLKAYGTIMDLERGASHQLWSELRRLSVLHGGDGPVWRISTEPTAGPKVVAAISSFMDCRAFYDWSGGLVWAEVLPTTDAGAADVRRVIAAHGGHATLIRADPNVRAAVEVFQPLETGLARLSRRLKTAFDPAGILNPGRMYAGM